MNELVPVFETSLFDSPIMDIGMEFAEIGIDAVLNDGLLKDIPIVSTVVGLSKFAQNIYDRNLLRQTLMFIKEFNSNGGNSNKVEQHRRELQQNPKRMEAELGRVLIILNKNIDLIKSQFEAKFYAAYINEQIGWEDFCELCDVTDRLFVSDIDNLKEAYVNNGVKENMPITYRYDRLISVGLLVNKDRISSGLVITIENSEEALTLIDFTDMGKKFCSLVFD